MKNNKGFTLVELLAIIVILALIILVAAPSMTKQIKKKEDTEQTVLNEKIYNASRMYAAKYYASEIVKGSTFSFTLQNLEEDGLLDLKGKCDSQMNNTITYNGNYNFSSIIDGNCADNSIPND